MFTLLPNSPWDKTRHIAFLRSRYAVDGKQIKNITSVTGFQVSTLKRICSSLYFVDVVLTSNLET
jgi:hypothetical protein